MFKVIFLSGGRSTFIPSALKLFSRGKVSSTVQAEDGFGTFVFPNEGDTSKEPQIPQYEPRINEPVETMRARLLYQSRKRGMLENGLLLSTFAAKFLGLMNEFELKQYDRLINCPSNDWDIYYWATGMKPIPAEFDTPTMDKFIAHVQNKNKESRFRQPDLFE